MRVEAKDSVLLLNGIAVGVTVDEVEGAAVYLNREETARFFALVEEGEWVKRLARSAYNKEHLAGLVRVAVKCGVQEAVKISETKLPALVEGELMAPSSKGVVTLAVHSPLKADYKLWGWRVFPLYLAGQGWTSFTQEVSEQEIEAVEQAWKQCGGSPHTPEIIEVLKKIAVYRELDQGGYIEKLRQGLTPVEMKRLWHRSKACVAEKAREERYSEAGEHFAFWDAENRRLVGLFTAVEADPLRFLDVHWPGYNKRHLGKAVVTGRTGRGREYRVIGETKPEPEMREDIERFLNSLDRVPEPYRTAIEAVLVRLM